MRLAAAAALLAAGLAADTPPETVLWRDPGRVELIDFAHAWGGPSRAPRPPFRFLSEDETGTSPKVMAEDAAGVKWRVKGGLEVRAETFATRFASALGYYADATYFLPAGRMEGVHNLKRAAGFIKPDGSFTYASFKRVETHMKYLGEQSWNWNTAPFAATEQARGLRIVVMLLSNWDNKDIRDRRRGSNLGILETHAGGRKQWIYFVNDWGKTLGSWGHFYNTRSSWDCNAYRAQTPGFARLENGKVRFAYIGQHTYDFRAPVTRDDVRWLMRYLGRITDAQIRTGLRAAGATAEEERCFAAALRDRITQLQAIAQDKLQ